MMMLGEEAMGGGGCQAASMPAGIIFILHRKEKKLPYVYAEPRKQGTLTHTHTGQNDTHHLTKPPPSTFERLQQGKGKFAHLCFFPSSLRLSFLPRKSQALFCFFLLLLLLFV
jgi:hypothetical protein